MITRINIHSVLFVGINSCLFFADMSQKFGKRHKKKSDADVEANMEALHDEKDTNNGSAEKSNGDESELKGFTIEEIDDSATAQEGVQKKVEEEAENVNKIEENGRNGETESTKEETVKNADSQETQEPEATAADAEEMELQFDEDSDKDSNKGKLKIYIKSKFLMKALVKQNIILLMNIYR